jgi:hypothetical protein
VDFDNTLWASGQHYHDYGLLTDFPLRTVAFGLGFRFPPFTPSTVVPPRTDFAELELSIRALLSCFRRYGEVYIVSAAPQSRLNLFGSLFDRVATPRNHIRSSLFKGKLHHFKDIVKQGSFDSVISIGDGQEEKKATRALRSHFPGLPVFFVEVNSKFGDRGFATATELRDMHRQLESWVTSRFPGGACLCLDYRVLPQQVVAEFRSL